MKKQNYKKPQNKRQHQAPFKNKKREFADNKMKIYGKHPVLLAIKACQRKIHKIYVNKKHQDFVFNYLQKHNLNSLTPKLQFVETNVLDRLFRGKVNHQGFVIEASRKPRLTFGTFLKKCNNKESLPRVLILDQLTDPHNIGAIIRTSVAFGVKNIIVTTYNFPQESATIIKSSAGMTEFVDLIEVVNLNKTIEELKGLGYTVVGLDGYAETYITEVKAENIALVLGSEGKGIRPLVKKNCDVLAKIPMSEKVESLNASVAGAIAVYEIWGK